MVTPLRPSAPPVSGVALLAISRHTAAMASVSISCVRPRVLKITAPVVMPSTAAVQAAAPRSTIGSLSPSLAARMPAV